MPVAATREPARRLTLAVAELLDAHARRGDA